MASEEPSAAAGTFQQALAHVYASDLGISLANETVDLLSYDDASGLLLVIKGSVVFAYDTNSTTPGHHDQLKWTYPLQEGPKVLAVRVSLDGGLVALQRSRIMIELVDLATGNCCVHASNKGRCEVLTFFFTDVPDSEVVLVTRGGIECCTFAPRRQGLRRTGTMRLPIVWARYTYETRMLLTGVGPLVMPYLQAWQFVASGTVSLPPFTVAASPVALGSISALGPLPAPVPVVASGGANGQLPPPAESVQLLKMYGRVYAAYVHVAASRLDLHRVYTDTVVLQHSYELFSRSVQLSVVDNVLVVHYTDSAVSMLFDVAADTSSPVTHPLPLALLPHGSEPGQAVVRTSSSLAMSSWRFYPPATIVDPVRQAVYRLHLDLQAVSASAPDPGRLAGFLLRRRRPARAGLDVAPHTLLLSVLRHALQDRLPVATLRKMFDDLMVAYADAAAAAAGLAGPPGTVIIPPQVLSPDDLGRSVFRWMHEEEAAALPYLGAALTEFKAAAVNVNVVLPADLQRLGIEIQLRQKQAYQVMQVLHGQSAHMTDAAADQLEAAAGLDNVGNQQLTGCLLADAKQLVADIRARTLMTESFGNNAGVESGPEVTGADVEAEPNVPASTSAGALERHVRSLLTAGEVLRAIKDVRALGSLAAAGVPPAAEFLEAAGRTGNANLFAGVYRTFSAGLMTQFPQFDAARAQYLRA